MKSGSERKPESSWEASSPAAGRALTGGPTGTAGVAAAFFAARSRFRVALFAAKSVVADPAADPPPAFPVEPPAETEPVAVESSPVADAPDPPPRAPGSAAAP